MFLDVFNLAMKISDETDGAFDITVAPLVNAWGFGFKNGIEPSKQQVDSLMQIIGYQKVSLEKGKICKADDRIMLDCSAIAKGYGTDVVQRKSSSWVIIGLSRRATHSRIQAKRNAATSSGRKCQPSSVRKSFLRNFLTIAVAKGP